MEIATTVNVKLTDLVSEKENEGVLDEGDNGNEKSSLVLAILDNNVHVESDQSQPLIL